MIISYKDIVVRDCRMDSTTIRKGNNAIRYALLVLIDNNYEKEIKT